MHPARHPLSRPLLAIALLAALAACKQSAPLPTSDSKDKPEPAAVSQEAIAVAAIAREQISAHADGQLAKVSPLGGAVEDQIESPMVGRRVGSTTKRPGATYSAHMTARRSLKRSPAKSLIARW